MIRVYLKDGLSVYEFEDAKLLRALLHDKPGHKPTNQEPIEAAQLLREREDGSGRLTGNLVRVGANAKLRYLARQSISHVEEVG